MELRHLRYFVAVAEELSYRKAAERLRVAQPALSSQIKDLEYEVGAQLLDRDTGGVRLTDAGAAFLEEARLIAEHAQRAVVVAREAAKGRRGRLSIGYYAPIFMDLIPPSLEAFAEKFPDVEVTLMEMPFIDQIAALEAGTIQVGFTIRGLVPIPQGLKSTDVARAPIRVVIGRSHRLARVARISLSDLVNEPLLCFAAKKGVPSMQDEIMRRAFAARGLKTKAIRTIDGAESFRATLESGQGVSLIAEVGSFSRSRNLCFKPLKDKGDDLTLHLLALSREEPVSRITNNFIELMREVSPKVLRN